MGRFVCCSFSKKLNSTISFAFISCTLSPRPKVICYNSLISASGKGSEWSWALHFFQELSRSGSGQGLLPFLHIRSFWVSFTFRWWFHDSMTDFSCCLYEEFLWLTTIGRLFDVQATSMNMSVPKSGWHPQTNSGFSGWYTGLVTWSG